MGQLRETVTTQLRELREKSGLSLGQLGQRMGIARQSVNKLELGQIGETLDRVEQFAKACGGDVVAAVLDRDTRPRADLLRLVLALPADALPSLARLLSVWLTLSRQDRELLAYTAEVRAGILAEEALKGKAKAG